MEELREKATNKEKVDKLPNLHRPWIDETKIKAIVDLSGYKEGDHEVTITVTGDDVKATYTPKTTKIKIRISKK